MVKKFLKLFSFFLFIAVSANAQQIWSLEECINHAMEHNLVIRQQALNARISDQNLIQSRAAQLPSLNGNVTHNFNLGRTIDPFTNLFTQNNIRSNNFSLFSSVVLFNGFQTRNTIRQSEYEYLASTYEVERVKNDVALSIASAYLQVLFSEEMATAVSLQVELSRQQLQRARGLVEAGRSPEALVFEIQSQLAFEEMRLVEARNQIELSSLNLAQLMDLRSEERIRIRRPEIVVLTDTAVLDVNEVYQSALETQPQIKSAEFSRLGFTSAYKAARGRYSPRLNFSGSISTLYASSSMRLRGYELTGVNVIGFTQDFDTVYAPSYRGILERKPFEMQVRDNYNKFVGFTLNIPILNGLQVRTAVNRARLMMERAQLNLELTKLNLEKNIRMAHADAIAGRKKYSAAQQAVRAQEEAFRSAERRFELGLVNVVEYAQMKNRLAISQSDLLQAKYDYIFRMKVLDFYRGLPWRL